MAEVGIEIRGGAGAAPGRPGPSPVAALAEQWAELREREPKLRIRDAAERLGVSEAALLETRMGAGVARLSGSFQDLLKALAPVGPLMALTRNEAAVHEKTGVYDKLSFDGHVGLALNRDIDLRLFMGRWAHGYAVEDAAREAGPLTSFQFFDRHGTAVHKIYRRDGSSAPAWEAVRARHLAADQEPRLAFAPPEAAKEEGPEAIDVARLRARWAAMTDPHQFFPLLRELKVSRRQALTQVGEDWSRPVAAASFRQALETAAGEAIPIMVFVGNKGCIQIHTGPVKKVVAMGPWINVLDPGFDLHVRQDLIAKAFVVRKPTRDGDIHSLELLDARGEVIALMFGERGAGNPEREDWRALAATLA